MQATLSNEYHHAIDGAWRPSKIRSRRQKVERRMGQLTQAREWHKSARYSDGVLI